ncbi:MAG: N-acetylmuramoyl-L-alanine amidase [Candidatus Poribacteria bacterium]|nr:N-acetylmuramoyl-L-alanine amidase [Candidatus Poribacteria bacterium]
MKPCYVWIVILLLAVISSGCTTMPTYNELADRHYNYTSGEKNATLDEWHGLISEFENVIRRDAGSESADDAQYAIASCWVWCIKAGDSEAPQSAIAAFRRLIYTHPDSEHLPQAHYWIACCYTLIGDSARASHHYQIVTNRYAGKDIAAEALLELGRTYAQHGYKTRAETLYVEIVESAAKKEIVSTASKELQELKTPQNPVKIPDKTPTQPKIEPKPQVKPPVADPEALTPGSFTREFGLTAKTIVIDAGHGGKDPGGGRGDIIEKPIVLSLSKKIGAILRAKGYTVLLTRETDRFIPLKERTAFATRHKADLFLSIHANASENRQANGIETYYLDVKSTDKNAEIIAARENANSGYSIQELESLLKGLIVESKSKDSRRLAKYVQQELVASTGAADRGVKHARFVVLIGTSVPAILVETGFVTNPTEGRKLTSDAYQQQLAAAIVQGIEKFLGSAEQISQDNSNQPNKYVATTKR